MEIIDQEENGLFPDTWGPHAWEFLHSVAHAYPINPTLKNKNMYKQFYTSLQYVLPCAGCKKSYKNFNIDESALKNRDTLTKWVYDLHEKVNHKLGKTYNVSYDEICDKYNSYRIKDNMDINDIAICYKAECKKEVPYMIPDIAKKFTNYAKERGEKTFDKNIEKIIKIKKDSDLWEKRTKKCRTKITTMRQLAIPNIETSGKYKNLPTIDELKLIKNLCTTISHDTIEKMIQILDGTEVKENLADGEGKCTDCMKPTITGGGKKYVFIKN